MPSSASAARCTERRNLEWEAMVPRKARRFMEAGIGWNYVAMEQAIRDAGLEARDVVNERTGIIMGSGGPSTRAIVRAADVTRRKGPQEDRPVRGAQGNVLGPIRGAGYRLPDQGHQLFDLIGLRDLGALHRQCRRADPMGQAGRDVRGRLRGARLDAVGRCSMPWERCRPSSTPRPAKASRAYDKDRDGFVIAGGAGVVVLEELERAKSPGRQDLRRARRIRRQLRRLRHGGAVGRRRRALHAHGHAGHGRQGRRQDRLHQPARHRHAGRGSERRSTPSARCSARNIAADFVDQIADRPFARRRRRAGGHLLPC